MSTKSNDPFNDSESMDNKDNSSEYEEFDREYFPHPLKSVVQL